MKRTNLVESREMVLVIRAGHSKDRYTVLLSEHFDTKLAALIQKTMPSPCFYKTNRLEIFVSIG